MPTLAAGKTTPDVIASQAVPVRWRRSVGLCVVGVVLWLSYVVWPVTTGATGFEDSWLQVLHYGISHGWQWGRDLIFTYGPLGFLLTYEYFAETFPWIVAWNLIGLGGCIGLTVFYASRLTSWLGTTILLGLLLIFSSFGPIYGRDFLYFMCLWSMGCGYISSQSTSRWPPIAIILLATILSLAKFTCFAVYLTLVAAFLIHAWSTSGLRRSGELLATSLGMGAGIWIACGQKFATFAMYLRSSLEISRGYSRAMTGPFKDEVELVFAALIALGLLLLLALRCGDSGSRISKLLTAGISAIVAFIVWKHGFVRQDGHCIMFFAVTACMACMAWLENSSSRRIVQAKSMVACAVIALCLLAAFRRASNDGAGLTVANFASRGVSQVATNAKVLFQLPSHSAAQAERRRHLQATEGVAELRRLVGDEPIAWFMNSQTIPLMTGLSLYPRGVVQSYSAYTEWLANQNAEHFRADSRPRFAAVRIDLTDGRFPMADDGPALLELLARYRPLSNCAGSMLLEQKANHDATEILGETLIDQEIDFEKIVELPASTDSWNAASFDIRYSPRGTARTLYYKSPQVRLQVEASDGKVYDYHLVADMCHAWFLLDPLVTNNEDFAHLSVGAPERRTIRFRVHLAAGDRACFQERIGLRIRKFRPLPRLSGKERDRLLCPSLFAAPVEADSLKQGTALLHGQSVYQLTAPGWAKLALPTNANRVRGVFGQLEETSDERLKREGVFFEVRYESEDGAEPVILLRRKLNPWNLATDRGDQHFDVALPLRQANQSAWLKLTTKAGDLVTEGCYWRDLKCE